MRWPTACCNWSMARSATAWASCSVIRWSRRWPVPCSAPAPPSRPASPALVWARAAVGAAAAGIIPLAMAWIGDQVAYAQRQETLARLLMATVTGMMVGQWWGGFCRRAPGLAQRLWRARACCSCWPACLLWRSGAPGGRAHTGRAVFTSSTYLRATAALAARATRALGAGRDHRWKVRWPSAPWRSRPAAWCSTSGCRRRAAGAVMVLYGVGGLVYAQLVRRWLRLLGEKGLALMAAAR